MLRVLHAFPARQILLWAVGVTEAQERDLLSTSPGAERAQPGDEELGSSGPGQPTVRAEVGGPGEGGGLGLVTEEGAPRVTAACGLPPWLMPLLPSLQI